MSFTTTTSSTKLLLLTHVSGGYSICTTRGVSYVCPKKSLKLSGSTSNSSTLWHYHNKQQAFSLEEELHYHHSNFRPFRVKCSQSHDVGNVDVSSSGETPNQGDRPSDKSLADLENETGSSRSSLLAKLAIALGVAATVTLILVGLKWPMQGSPLGVPTGFDASSASAPSVPLAGFTFKVFGYQFTLPQYAPGWVYFWLLMAAGFGLFVSEEALNIWVGISLARVLTIDGTWKSFAESFSRNSPYIISTVLWVYWGVCISDMVPFYIGRLFRQSGASDDVCSKLGIGKEKAASVTQAVQRYGNLIGFVERFSVGVRNPTSFLAGSLGISAECFFAGVCCGGLFTLPIQLGIGFLLRENPVVALASVATVVGIWSLFPYAMAALTALFLFLRPRHSD
ncbi:uncharacterized protein LOC113296789 [Papaver somniferum]|uniref:uncharacterized protein LOC113296789 n=1 Tax=Papaver somniferum TaxID=3469 RepID=UPI000E6FB5C1|nr:uncharacterized protein LOC113296789 [Papaver somniferum]